MNWWIRLTYKHNAHKLMRGVYRITMGNKFYIGRTRFFATRVWRHDKALNQALRYYPDLLPDHEMYREWCRYLHENPKIKEAKCEIIHYCEDDDALHEMENKLLREVLNHPDCLNRTFQSVNPRRKTDKWCVEYRDFIPYFYDPADPEKKSYSCFSILTETGRIASERSKEMKEHRKLAQKMMSECQKSDC
jgi:hypothetical protein